MFSPHSASPPQRNPSLREQREPKGAALSFPSGWCTYMLLCIDGSYYVGLAIDLAQRLQDHSSGKGPTYTKLIKPKFLVWYESHPDRSAAQLRERQLKGWSRT